MDHDAYKTKALLKALYALGRKAKSLKEFVAVVSSIRLACAGKEEGYDTLILWTTIHVLGKNCESLQEFLAEIRDIANIEGVIIE